MMILEHLNPISTPFDTLNNLRQEPAHETTNSAESVEEVDNATIAERVSDISTISAINAEFENNSGRPALNLDGNLTEEESRELRNDILSEFNDTADEDEDEGDNYDGEEEDYEDEDDGYEEEEDEEESEPTPSPAPQQDQTVTDTYNAIPEDNENVLRYSSAPWFEKASAISVSIYGLGGTGSFATMALSRLGLLYIHGIDDDVVEERNLAGQAYTHCDVGRPKAYAVGDIANRYSTVTSNFFYKKRYTGPSDLNNTDVTISAFDNMDARRILYRDWKRKNVGYNNRLFIDLRMAAETIQIFCFTAADGAFIEDYERSWLFPSSEAEQTSCSYKQTTFASMIMGGLTANLVANYINNIAAESDSLIIERPLPYKTFYDASIMNFNIVQ